MVEVERIDVPNSFQTILKFNDGNTSQEIPVFSWEADAIESKLMSIDSVTINQIYTKTGKKPVKTW